jgi:hypothetical protein
MDITVELIIIPITRIHRIAQTPARQKENTIIQITPIIRTAQTRESQREVIKSKN